MNWLACLLAVHLWSLVGVLAIIYREDQACPAEDDNDV